MSIEHKIDATISAEMQRQHIPGLSLAIIDKGALVLSKGYGLANVELAVPATADTVYEIASLTKLFTATAIMLLVEEGKVNLADSIAQYCPPLPDPWAAITLRHLLSHTSGVNYWSLDWTRADLTAEEIYQDAFRLPLSFKPGERSDYCDVNYNMLGMVIHQVTGKPYHAFLRERVFARLNMNAIRHHDWRAIVPNRAAGYAWEAGELKNCEGIKWHPLSDTTQAVPANGANGSLLCSVNDLAKWDAALYTEQIIAQATLQQMWTPTTLTDGTKAGAGLGWQIDEKNGLRLAAHGGMNPAFGVWYGRYVEEQLAVIVFINLGFGSEEWTEERGPAPWVIGNRIAEVYNPTLKRG